jgi:hypothetical protein
VFFPSRSDAGGILGSCQGELLGGVGATPGEVKATLTILPGSAGGAPGSRSLGSHPVLPAEPYPPTWCG